MRHHEKSVTNCEDRRAINDDAIKQRCSLGNQLSEKWPGKNLSWIRRAAATPEDEPLPSSPAENVFRQLNALIDELDFSGWNLTCCRGKVRFTNQAIRHSRRAVFIGIISCTR